MKTTFLSVVCIFFYVSMSGQSQQCVLLSDACCSGHSTDEFVTEEINQNEPRSVNQASVFVRHAPIVHIDRLIEDYPLEVEVKSSTSVEQITIRYFDFVDQRTKESILSDDGQDLDIKANDGIYTSDGLISRPLPLRRGESIKHHQMISGTLTINFENGGSEAFLIKQDGITLDDAVIQLDTNITVRSIGNFYYTENAALYVQDQIYNGSDVNYPFRDIQDEFESTWTNFEDPISVFTSFTDANDEGRNFRTYAGPPVNYIVNMNNRGMTTAFPLNHEFNHYWIYSGRFAITPNHLRYVALPRSGFGYGCGNGVFTDIFEENGVTTFRTDKTDSHDYFFNNLELHLMGVLPIDSVPFPIKYYKWGSGPSPTCTSFLGNRLSGGSIDFITQDSYESFMAGRNVPDVSDGLEAKFIFLSERPFTKLEHALLEYLVLNYEGIFEESTKNLVDLQTELYPLFTTSSVDEEENALQVDVFPNPANDEVMIKLASFQTAQLTVVDLAGRVYKAASLQNGRNLLDVGDLPGGIYLLKILAVDGTFYTEKVIKR